MMMVITGSEIIICKVIFCVYFVFLTLLFHYILHISSLDTFSTALKFIS